MNSQVQKEPQAEWQEAKKLRAVIVSGGTLDEDHVLPYLLSRKFDYIICADHGLQFLYREGITPTHIVGDFDSLRPEILESYMSNPKVRVRIYSPMKDQTDTELAINLALELGVQDILVLGWNGPRVDHTLGNISSLMIPLCEENVTCILEDAHNRLEMVRAPWNCAVEESFGRYLSLVPWDGPVTGLNVSGVKYPLENELLTADCSLGISNEIMTDCRIDFTAGTLLIIQSRD